MKRLWSVLIFAALASCSTTGSVPTGSLKGVRQPAPAPNVKPAPVAVDFELPSPLWPQRQGGAAPKPAAPVLWRLPVLPPEPLPMPSVAAVPQPPPGTPGATVNSPPGSNPAPAASPAPRGGNGPKASPAPKPATTAVQPKPSAKPAPQPPTAASTASLLPGDKTTGADFRWQDVNAVAGDSVTLHFDRTNWLYLDSAEQQKKLGFLSTTYDKDATTFQFKPLLPGDYTLEFQRQDLVNQSTDVRRVRLTVVPVGTRTALTGTALSPQTSALPPDDALEAARKLAGSGRTSEAVKKLLQTYKAGDARANLELARLLNQDGQNDDALGFLDRNLGLPGPDFQGTLELGTKLAAVGDPQKRLPTYVKLWSAGTTAPPEDLYLQVLDALRAGKLDQAKDWAGRYGLWYNAPTQRDRYLYVLGQFLEEPGPNRDIRAAWQAYNEVATSYPLSRYWKPAGDRAAYINRHFLQAR